MLSLKIKQFLSKKELPPNYFNVVFTRNKLLRLI